MAAWATSLKFSTATRPSGLAAVSRRRGAWQKYCGRWWRMFTDCGRCHSRRFSGAGQRGHRRADRGIEADRYADRGQSINGACTLPPAAPYLLKIRKHVLAPVCKQVRVLLHLHLIAAISSGEK